MSHEPDAVVYETQFCRGMHATRSSWGAAEVAGVIEQRFARGLALVVTSNLDLPGLADTIDPRVTSRLGAFGNAWSFPAKDLRMAGRIKAVNRRLGGRHALSAAERGS